MMKKENAPSLKHPSIALLSLGGVGLCPWAPGTAGSLAALPIFYLLGEWNPPLALFLPLLIGLIAASCLLAHRAQRNFGFCDPPWLVLDEAVGMLVAWPIVNSNHWVSLLLVFLLFRFFDVVKPWPASYFDKKVDHAAGIILDDVVSGLYAGICFVGVAILMNIVIRV